MNIVLHPVVLNCVNFNLSFHQLHYACSYQRRNSFHLMMIRFILKLQNQTTKSHNVYGHNVWPSENSCHKKAKYFHQMFARWYRAAELRVIKQYVPKLDDWAAACIVFEFLPCRFFRKNSCGY